MSGVEPVRPALVEGEARDAPGYPRAGAGPGAARGAARRGPRGRRGALDRDGTAAPRGRLGGRLRRSRPGNARSPGRNAVRRDALADVLPGFVVGSPPGLAGRY